MSVCVSPVQTSTGRYLTAYWMQGHHLAQVLFHYFHFSGGNTYLIWLCSQKCSHHPSDLPLFQVNITHTTNLYQLYFLNVKDITSPQLHFFNTLSNLNTEKASLLP